MASAGLIADALEAVELDLEAALHDRQELKLARTELARKAARVGLTRDQRDDAERELAGVTDRIYGLSRRIPALTRRHVALQDALAVSTGD